MARFRSSARKAPRFTGEQFGSGFQYKKPSVFSLSLGPWKEFLQSGPPDTLEYMYDCYIRGGCIVGIGTYSNATVVSKVLLGVYEFPIAFVPNNVVFRKDTASGFVEIVSDNGTATVTTLSAIVAGTSEIAAEVWGGYIYFGSRSLTGGMYRYEKATVTFSAAIAGAPANIDFLFVLNNNLVAVHKTASIWTIQWSVDGLPEDWTGTGSGSAFFPSVFGEVKAVVKLGEAYYIIGQAGTVRMTPTGTLPPFRFENIYNLYTNNYKGAASYENLIYFITLDEQVNVFDGNNISPTSSRISLVTADTKLVALKRAGFVVSTTSDFWNCPLIFIEGRQVGLVDVNAGTNFIADSPPSTTSRGNAIFYHPSGANYVRELYELSPSGDLINGPTEVDTPFIDLGEMVAIDYVEVELTVIDSGTVVACVVVAYIDSITTSNIDTVGPQEIRGMMLRYPCSTVARYISITLSDSGAWDTTQAIKHINIVGRKIDPNDKISM